MGGLSASVFVHHVCGVPEGARKRALDPLELELQKDVGCHVDTGI